MAKGEHYSAYQQKVINRYYEHADTRVITKLQELVSELFLAADAKTADKLWKSAKLQLENTKTEGAKIDKIVNAKDVKALAELVAKLTSK